MIAEVRVSQRVIFPIEMPTHARMPGRTPTAVMTESWSILQSEIAFHQPWLRVRRDAVQLPSGRILDDYYVWLEGDVSLVVPVTPQGEFLLVSQYKHAAGQVVLEFPAGMVDSGESAEEAAIRELREETGFAAKSVTHLGSLMNHPTKVVGQLHVFLATGCERVCEPLYDDSEMIETLLLKFDELFDHIRSGKIVVTGTISAAWMAANHMGRC